MAFPPDPSQPTNPVGQMTPPVGQATPPAMPPQEQDIPEELQQALIDLCERFEKENIQARTEEVRRVQRQREFFKGNQNIYWSGTDRQWKGISSTSQSGLDTKDGDDEDAIRYDFTENIYRANCLISMAVLSQNPSHCLFAPADPSNPDDIATAKAALDVEKFVGDNNKLDQRQAEVAWYWFNDGRCASYTYFEVDADKYGVKVVPRIEPVQQKITPDTLHCPQCGYDVELPNMDYNDPANLAAVPQTCPDCGAPLDQGNFVPGTTSLVPQQTGEDHFPQGQEKILYVGALELQLPFFARSLEEAPWLTWECEVHKAWIKSVYPKAATPVGSGNSEGGADSAEMTARSARISLAATMLGRSTGEAWGSLVTFKRTWLRSWAFQYVEDDMLRAQLQQLFPDGCYVARAGRSYCESRNEKIEKRWVLSHCFQGDGMIRDGIGTDIVDTQRRLNVEENIATETYERGLPVRVIDGRVVDFDAYVNAGSLAAAVFEGQAVPGQRIGDAFYDSPAVAVSPQMVQHSESLRGPIPQMLTGNFPTIFGGDTGGNDTASGISMEKDSAYGRFALFKRAINEFYAETMLNAIDCFVENRTEDVQLAVFGKGGELDSKSIKLADLRGNLYARTEADDSYPVSPVQRRSLILSLIQSPNQQIQAALLAPDNFETLKTAIGMQDLKLAGEDARKKEFRTIQKIIETGQQIPPDVLLDQHKVCEAACQEWWSSDEGQQIAESNPSAAELIRQHMLAHMQAEVQLQQLQQGLEQTGQPMLMAPNQAAPQQVPPQQGGGQPPPQQVQ